MPDNDRFPLPVLCVAVNAIHRPDTDNKIGQILQDVRRVVFLQAVASAVAGQVHSNGGRRVLNRRRVDDVTPYGPAVREPMDEDDQRLIAVRAGLVVANIVECEAAAEGHELMRKTRPFVRQIPEPIASYLNG